VKVLKEMKPEELRELLNASDSKANGAKSGQEKELQSGKEQPLPVQPTPAPPAQPASPSQSAVSARSAGPAVIPLELLQPAATTRPAQ